MLITKTVGVGKIMKIEFGDFEFTECWDGVLYKKLSGYPEMTDWEIQTVLDFIKYEKDNGRECELVGDENILAKVRDAIADRNAANDPEDYFDYIMFAWGNCQAGDRLVMERKLGRFPDDKDLSIGFTPGVRFFFKYNEIVKHPNAVFEGVLPLKIKNEVVLADWIHAIIVPEKEKNRIESYVPEALKEKVHYIENDCYDIWEWSEKVYEYAKNIDS